jgi:hypothetical protein
VHRRAPSFALLALLSLVPLIASRCASPQCQINSDCPQRQYCTPENICLQECAEDRDCEGRGVCSPNGRCIAPMKLDAGPDAAPDATLDVAAEPSLDAPDVAPPPDLAPPPDVTPPPDLPPPPPDLPPPPDVAPPPDVTPRGAYLDPCTSTVDCQSMDCAPLGGASGFCTRSCTSRRDCGDGYLCARGRCVADDTGAACNPVGASACAAYCFGNSASGRGHCTRECSSGRDCPAGYACQPVSGTPVCVEVETTCSRAADCVTNLCLGPMGSMFRGCTALCRTAADCPQRLTIEDAGRLISLPAYTCEVVGGDRVCVPPIQGIIAGGDLAGSDPIGSTCNGTPGATVLCRSGVCDSDDVPPTCVQGCTPTGGCPSGFACRPWLPDGPTGSVYLVCRPAGRGGLGSTCTRGSDCATGLCQAMSAGDPSGYCTRFCTDTFCPTGMRCTPAGTAVGGTPIAICTR